MVETPKNEWSFLPYVISHFLLTLEDSKVSYYNILHYKIKWSDVHCILIALTDLWRLNKVINCIFED